jgi:hypothetical protein
MGLGLRLYELRRARLARTPVSKGYLASWSTGGITAGDSRSSQMRSQIRCTLRLRDGIDAAGRPVASWTSPATMGRNLRECT